VTRTAGADRGFLEPSRQGGGVMGWLLEGAILGKLIEAHVYTTGVVG